jgi:hypothetical protein
VASRHLLAATGADIRPSTIPAALSAADLGRTRHFLDALARWSRRPAEWADVAPAARGTPLSLAGAPRPIAVHAPPLAPPAGADVVVLPPPARENPSGAPLPTPGVPGWIRRQGMRGLWSRSSPRSLDSALAFVDAAALNVVATVGPAPLPADSLAQHGPWRGVADRLRATSLRWFPAIALEELRRQANLAAATPELDVRGDTAAVWCGLDPLLWSAALRPAFRTLARLGVGRADVIAGIALDLDVSRGGYAGTGFCDATYREGLRALGTDSADAERLAALPPAERYGALRERGLIGRYFDGLERLVAERAAEIRREVQRTNPDLRFAVHSAQAPADWFSLGMLRGLSTPDAPVLVWTRERQARDLVSRYRDREIFVLSAVGLAPDGVAAGEWPRLRRLAFVEHDGFWVPAPASDSVGRLIRRLAR